MNVRRPSLACVVALAAVLAGCGGGAAALLETAQFEEVQHNPEHARQIYEVIVQRFPGTPEAATAIARLQALRDAH